MISDSHFEIGSTHSVCQDYALHGCSSDNKMYYSIIADGCSSSKHSEIGANILCHVAKYYLTNFYSTGIINHHQLDVLRSLLEKSIYTKANEIRTMYSINQSALDATLMISFMIGDNTYVYTWGDGVVIFNYENYVKVYDYEYTSGAPFYLSYLNNTQPYKDKFGDGLLHQNTYTIENDEIVFERTIMSYTHRLKYQSCKNTLKSVIIGSDGLTSYLDIDNKGISTTDIAKELLGYKRITGEFMKSNILFMNKRNKKNSITHYDDMSCGIVLREK